MRWEARKREIEDRIKALLDEDSPWRVVLNAKAGLDSAEMNVYGVGKIVQTLIDEQHRALEYELGLFNNALQAEEAGDILKVLVTLAADADIRNAIVEGLYAVRGAADAALIKAVPEDVIDVEGEEFNPAGELESGE